MCSCHGNAWCSSSENSIFHNAMLYWSCVPEVTGSRIFPQKMLYHGNDDSAHSKNDWRLRFTITHLHAKFEDDPRSGKTAEAKGK